MNRSLPWDAEREDALRASPITADAHALLIVGTPMSALTAWLSIICLSIVMIVLSSGCTQKRDRGEAQTSLTSSHKQPALPLGRVTAIYPEPDAITIGHESGTISAWRWRVAERDELTLDHEQTWFAHEGAVRVIDLAPNFVSDRVSDRVSDQVSESAEREAHIKRLLSVGAGGSWAIWSGSKRVSPRLRAGEAYVNSVISDRRGGWLIAGARGLVARWGEREPRWSGVGEHGRAAFDLGLLDERHVISVGSDGALRCWRIERGDTCGVIRVHDGWAVALKHTRAARALGDAWVSAGSDGVVNVWPSASLRSLLAESLRDHPQGLAKPRARARVHQRDITSLDVRGEYILSGGELGSVALLRVAESGALSTVWRVQSDMIAPVLSVAIDLKRERALIGGGTGGGLIWSAPLSANRVHSGAKASSPHREVKLTPLL